MSPKPDIATERRMQIVEAALACFTRKGYIHTTMDDIVAESGLSKGTLYWYFKSKDEVFKATMTAVVEKIFSEPMLGLQATETATGNLRAAAQVMVDLCSEIEGFFGLIIEYWSQSERRDEEMAFWAEMLTPYQHMVAAIFENGVQTGEFRKVDAGALAWMMMAAYDGLAAYSMMVPNLDVGTISETFIETLLKGLERS